MTTHAESPSTVEQVLAHLQQQLADLADPADFWRAWEDLQRRQAVLQARITTIRTSTSTLAEVAPEIAFYAKWRDQLTGWRKALCDELLALPPRVLTERELAKQQDLQQSIVKIDRGLDAVPCCRLRLDDLMARDGYVMPEPTYSGSDTSDQAARDRIAVRSANWYGALPDVEHHLKALQERRRDAQARLDATLHDAAAEAAAPLPAHCALCGR